MKKILHKLASVSLFQIYLPEKFAMKIISRSEWKLRCHVDIVEFDWHHQHQVFEDENGILRWVPDEIFINSIKNKNFNDVVAELLLKGLDKNCEEYRKVYRDIGYSLNGYWEVFYWPENNPIADQYIPNRR